MKILKMQIFHLTLAIFLLSGLLMIFNHNGLALKFLNLAYLVLFIGTILYIGIIKSENEI